jgi:spermidine/putrescine transport system ATP-binding protein
MPASPAARPDIDIRFVEVTKLFGEVRAVDRVSFAIPRGSFHSFLGPSGCGKTTSLRLIAGFEQPTSGDVQIGGASVVGVPAYRRPANMVFQHYALFPHMDVAGNIGYGLKQRKPRPEQAEIDRRVDEMLELVRLGGMRRRRIWELSGGQQQRVALARALINKPTVLLLDEPLAALDRKLRRDMQMELQSLQREVGITFVLVTHDQEEALSMSDSIAIMRDGRIEQFGSARDLYDAPVNRYVAGFVGESNFIAGEVVSADSDRATIRTPGGMALTAPYSAGCRALAMSAPGVIAVRPEAIRLWPAESAAERAELACAVAGRVQNRIYLGDLTEYSVATAELGDMLVRIAREDFVQGDELAPGREVKLGWRADRALALADN